MVLVFYTNIYVYDYNIELRYTGLLDNDVTGDLDITGKVSISGKAVINPVTSIGRLRISGSHRGIVKIYDTAKVECVGYIDANGETITINGKSHLTGNISITNECQIYDMGIDGTFDFNLKKSKIRQYDKDIRNGKLPGLHTGQAAV